MRADALKITPGLPNHLIDMAVIAYFGNRQEYRRRNKTEFPVPKKGYPGTFSVTDPEPCYARATKQAGVQLVDAV